MLALCGVLLCFIGCILCHSDNDDHKLSTSNYRVVVIGGGMGGHHVMYEMARKGIGNSTNKGASGNSGLILLEAEWDRICGIIEPVTQPESEGLFENPFSPQYKPYRVTTHAMRVNIATQIAMRCLANELNITLYFTPWATEYRVNGYKSYNGRFLCLANYTGADGFSSGCRAACSNGQANPIYTTDISATCNNHYGSADLVVQSTSLSPKIGPYTFFNYNPNTNYNQNNFDPEDEWYGWALGYSNYFNPTANYAGDGKAYNGASTLPFNASDPTQDHPRHRCSKFKELYMMYQYYLGPDYASFICDVNSGFRGDCTTGINPCHYIGSSTETGWLAREYQLVDEGYPVGSMTEFCTRQEYLTKHNKLHVPVSYNRGEKAIRVDVNKNPRPGVPRYIVETDKQIIKADEVIFAVEPDAIAAMSGSIPLAITQRPEFNWPKTVSTITITLHWKYNTSGWNWMDVITKNLWSSYRMLNRGSCVNRIDLINTPYHRNGKMRSLRATYTDSFCIQNLLSLALLDDPNDSLTPQEGYPVNGSIAQEQLRELRQLFAGEGPYKFYNVTYIPVPDKVSFDYEPYAWFYSKPGTTQSMKSISQWATAPLGTQERVALVHQAWNVVYSGWAISTVLQARNAVKSLFGERFFPATEMEQRRVCNSKHRDPWVDEDWGVTYNSPSAPSYAYDTPGLKSQTDYTNGMANERFPPYSWSEPIKWQP